ncbi:hypothetical protein ACFWY9_32185 [Amycolatopsis sp. NPDC059027]|uniref:hypothetical protein n=1 Tax=unclassified Amycolatopsis TaxID=2618356 RepID=UPI00366F2414
MIPGGGEEKARSATGFDLAWRGFHRGQVREFVELAETELRRRTAERDDARRQAARLAEENRELRARIDRISRTPIAPDALQERSRRMIELTREEAAEITTRAREKAEQTRRDAELEAVELTRRERKLVADAEEASRQAEQRRRELDEEAAARRARLEEDFAQAMALRRADAMRQLAERDAAAKAEAERRVREAGARAQKIVTEAEGKVAALEDVRARLAASLAGCRDLLAKANSALDPEPGAEKPAVPVQRIKPVAALTDVAGGG